MESRSVNNWKAAAALQKFKVQYLDPLEKRVEEGRKVMEDPNRKWKRGEKDAAKARLQGLDSRCIDYKTLYSAMMELIQQHESQTDMLTEIYQEWFTKISKDGKQPLEMMAMQQELLQGIWFRIFGALQPLKLNILPPHKDTNQIK
jgi:hypothetical protein